MGSDVRFSLRQVTRFAPVLAGLLVLTLYLATMPHGLTWDLGGADGGELATGVYTLGLVHSPGYPTYLLTAQIARLIPVDSFAWRLNIFSAFCAAGAVVLVGYMTARVIAGDDEPSGTALFAGGVAGLIFGLVEVVWTQAVITEVYALAALFCAAILYLTFWTERASSGDVFAQRLAPLSLIAGLGLGSHYMVSFVVLFAVAYLSLCKHQMFRGRNILLAVFAFGVGLGVFAYLPLRAGQVPVSNWGNPDTFERFWRVVSGADYADRFSLALAIERFASLIGVLVRQLTIPGVALAVLGLSLWWEERRHLLLAALPTVALNLILTAGYASADTLPYLIPTLLLLVLAAGHAVHTAAFRWLSAGRGWRALAAAGLALVVTVPLVLRGWPVVSEATTTAEDFGRRVVDETPLNSLLLTDDDRQTFAVRYAAAVSEGRPDLILVGTRLLYQEWFRRDLARFYPQLGLDDDTVMSPTFDAGALLSAVPPDVPVAIVNSQ